MWKGVSKCVRESKLVMADPRVTFCSACSGGAGTGEGAGAVQEHSRSGKRRRNDGGGESFNFIVFSYSCSKDIEILHQGQHMEESL